MASVDWQVNIKIGHICFSQPNYYFSEWLNAYVDTYILKYIIVSRQALAMAFRNFYFPVDALGKAPEVCRIRANLPGWSAITLSPTLWLTVLLKAIGCFLYSVYTSLDGCACAHVGLGWIFPSLPSPLPGRKPPGPMCTRSQHRKHADRPRPYSALKRRQGNASMLTFNSSSGNWREHTPTGPAHSTVSFLNAKLKNYFHKEKLDISKNPIFSEERNRLN